MIHMEFMSCTILIHRKRTPLRRVHPPKVCPPSRVGRNKYTNHPHNGTQMSILHTVKATLSTCKRQLTADIIRKVGRHQRGVIRSSKPNKNRQYNGQKKKSKITKIYKTILKNKD